MNEEYIDTIENDVENDVEFQECTYCNKIQCDEEICRFNHYYRNAPDENIRNNYGSALNRYLNN